ncbi:response regulator [Sphingomonas crocodyli]|uniref:histidine kinase n=2 Tax=Sphingomonas crocodyli TaxID=1979270 RepID=A0A437LV48_9SPHN|nr:ATP-binding protein [Sphingomonas crocodyli]RVT89247.1 response regulator [Sphingomonas crocodyli]
MGDRIAAFDWSGSLGPIEAWPQSLKTIVAFVVHSPVPIVMLWGEDGIMLYNDGYSVFAGDRHPVLLGSKVREGWGEVADFNDNVMKVGLAGGTLAYRDFVLTLNRTGEFEDVYLDLDYSPIYDDDGVPAGVLAIVIEISDRVRAERQLLADGDRLRFLDALSRATEASRDADEILTVTTRMTGEHLGVSICAYADMDADERGFTVRGGWSAPGVRNAVGHHRLTDFGQLAVSTLGEGRPQIINDSRAELPPADAATYLALNIEATVCMPLVKEGRLIALMAIHRDKPHHWTEAEIALIHEVAERSWAHVERVGAEAELRETAERLHFLNETLEARVAERAAQLQQSEATVRTVFETSFMAQGLLTPEGQVLYANTTALSAIGATLNDVAGRDYWDTPWFATTPGMADRVRETVASVAAGESIQFTMPLHLPTGERVYEFSMRPAFDPNGRIVALVPEASEVTARVRAEDALRQAQKMEAVGQLTGGLAHDFNNLLAAISGNLELLEKRIDQGRVAGLQRYIDNAQGGARRAAALTQRLLAFSRRQTLDPKPTDVNRLILGMEDLTRRSIGPLNELEIVGAAGLWTTRIDAPQLENALLNLCINARDAMAPNGGRITIETANKWLDDRASMERDMAPGQYISICVSDTGTGMDAETIARAFDPFFTTKPLGEGTGLGLSMVYGFARQSGGQVRIYSEVGRGTTMCIYLPRHHGTAEEEALAHSGETDHGDGERVLVIDDEPAIRALVVEVLEDAGYIAIEAPDGPSGLQILSTDQRIDLLITDVGLPGGMNGRQVADAARVYRPNLRVLFITGFAENAAVGNGLLAPGMEVITKPFAMKAISTKIRDLMDR